jgi:oligosaccharide repeat unit polymerase
MYWYKFSIFVEKSIVLVMIALCGLACGFGIARRKFRYETEHESIKLPSDFPELYWFSLSVAVIGGLIILTSSSLYTTYDQNFIAMNFSDQRIFGVALVFSPLMLIIAVGGITKPNQLKLIFIVFIIIVGAIFVAGWRGIGFITTLCLGLSFHKLDFKITKIMFRIIFLLLIIIFLSSYAIGKLRSDMVVETSLFQSIISLIHSSSQQIETLVFTTKFVESTEGSFIYGQSYFNSLTRIIPNLSLYWERGTFTNLGHMITRLYFSDAYDYSSGFGVSYCGIAEAYFNFGSLGVFFIYGFIGYLLIFIDYKSTSSLLWLSFYSLIFYCLIFGTTKGESALVFRPFAWICIFIGLLKLLNRIVTHNHSSRPKQLQKI